MNKIRNENWEITTAVQTIIRDGYEQIYGNTMDNLDEMNKFLEKYNLSKLNEKESEMLFQPHFKNQKEMWLHVSITCTEIKTVVKNLPTYKSPGPDGFTGEF